MEQKRRTEINTGAGRVALFRGRKRKSVNQESEKGRRKKGYECTCGESGKVESICRQDQVDTESLSENKWLWGGGMIPGAFSSRTTDGNATKAVFKKAPNKTEPSDMRVKNDSHLKRLEKKYPHGGVRLFF